MPGMNGFDFIKTVKNDMKLISIPIFAMTSYTSNENKRLAIESGATDFIFMPFEPMMVINRVDTSIRLNLAIYAKDRLIREANRDELTSLMNRKSLLNSIQADRLNKSTSTCSLIMVDLDNLKTINDQYGHAVGDICLRRLADFLKAHFADDGYIGRIGGDEFMIYLPKVNDEKKFKDKIDHLFNNVKTEIDPISGFSISFSLGLVLSKEKENFDKLYRQADAALYDAKRNGKARYAIFGEKSDIKNKGEHGIVLFSSDCQINQLFTSSFKGKRIINKISLYEQLLKYLCSSTEELIILDMKDVDEEVQSFLENHLINSQASIISLVDEGDMVQINKACSIHSSDMITIPTSSTTIIRRIDYYFRCERKRRAIS